MPKRAQARYVETDQFIHALHRMVLAAGRRVADSDQDQLLQLVEIRRALDVAIGNAVGGLRAQGVTWQEIGDVLGTSRQAAQQRWG